MIPHLSPTPLSPVFPSRRCPLPMMGFLRLRQKLGTLGLCLGLAWGCALPALGQSFPILIERGGTGTGSLQDQMLIRRNNGTASPQRDQADALMTQGDLAYRQGSYQKAIDTWKQALAYYQAIRDDEGVGIALDLIGLTYGDQGDFLAAEQALRQRLSVARMRRDVLGQIYALNNLGSVILQGGRIMHLDAAETTFQEALTLAEDVEDPEGQGLSLSNLGLVAAGRGESAKAVKLYEEALLFRQRGPNVAGEVNTLNNLGNAYWALGLYDEAIGAYGSALTLAKRIEDPYARIRAIDGLVPAHTAIGRTERALDLLTERLTLAQELGDVYQQFLSVQQFYRFYLAQEDFTAARSFLERSIGFAQTLGDTQTETRLLDELLQMDLDRRRQEANQSDD